MKILNILQDPDPRLRKPSRQVSLFDGNLRELAHAMLDTMYHLGGCGLAAPQVNTRQRLVVVDVSDRGDAPVILVNPSLRHHTSRLARFEEGCLSIPELYVPTHRPVSVSVEAWDVCGNRLEFEASDWLSAVIQHEVDHLDGGLLTDYLSAKAHSRYRKRRRLSR